MRPRTHGHHLRSRQARGRVDRDRLTGDERTEERPSRRPPAAACSAPSSSSATCPNAAARNLRTLNTRKILVTVPDISNPFFSLILQGIEDAAQREDYAVLVGDTQHDAAREDRYAQMLPPKEADGLIFLGHRLPPKPSSSSSPWRPERAPVVNGCEFSSQLGVPSVHIDNTKAAGRGRSTTSTSSAIAALASSPARS